MYHMRISSSRKRTICKLPRKNKSFGITLDYDATSGMIPNLSMIAWMKKAKTGYTSKKKNNADLSLSQALSTKVN